MLLAFLDGAYCTKKKPSIFIGNDGIGYGCILCLVDVFNPIFVRFNPINGKSKNLYITLCNSGRYLATVPNSVVHTGVKSLG